MAVAGSAGESLGQVFAGMAGGADMRAFHAGIEAGQHALGNRAFMHWVGELQSTGQDAAAQDMAAPLQMMPKKKKDQGAMEVEAGSGEQAEGAAKEAGAGSEGTVAPEAVEPTLRQGREGAEPAVVAPVKSDLTGKEQELFEACFRGVAERFRLLLRDGNIDINVANEYGTLLCHAAFFGHADIVGDLLPVPGIDVNLAGQQGATALYLAAQEGHVKVVERLLDRRGINVNRATVTGVTPLHIAAEKGRAEVVKLLLAAPGIRINQAAGERFIPLGAAVQQGHQDIARLLLSNGADPNIISGAGLSLLHIACLAGATAIVDMLLYFGADPDAEVTGLGGQTRTPASLAEHGGQRGVMAVLEVYRRRREAAHRLEWLLRTEQVGRRTETPPPEPVTEVEVETDGATARVSPIPPKPLPPGWVVPGTEPPTTLAHAKKALWQGVLGKLQSDYIDRQERSQLLEAFSSVADLDSLCVLYTELAYFDRARRRWRVAAAAPVFDLGGKTGLDAEAVQSEIKDYLGRAYHQYVCQVVNDMEFGQGKPMVGSPGLLYASAGVPGMGRCSVFYCQGGSGERKLIWIVGIGHLVGHAAYRLDYAAAELGSVGQILHIA